MVLTPLELVDNGEREELGSTFSGRVMPAPFHALDAFGLVIGFVETNLPTTGPFCIPITFTDLWAPIFLWVECPFPLGSWSSYDTKGPTSTRGSSIIASRSF